ncbi:MAG: leucyl/phenylalanyl-tRNA--protein transferase, partial [Proteobacteria bacterium]
MGRSIAPSTATSKRWRTPSSSASATPSRPCAAPTRLPGGDPIGAFPDVLCADADGLVWVGADLRPETVLEAYSRGLFPWRGDDPIPWYCPQPRAVLFPERFHASRSLRKLARQGRYEVDFDRDFRAVMTACARIPRAHEEGTWISPRMIDSYCELHRRGVAHSVEVRGRDGLLVGGLYGLTLGGFFFGESMFSAAPNSSKLALMALAANMAARGMELIDCQVPTRHLLGLGAEAIGRAAYLTRLARTLQRPSL